MASEPSFIGGRSTTDLLILLIASTICFSVLAAGATVAIIEIKDPSVDTSQAFKSVQDVINTLIGLLAGFLAGRTESTRETRQTARRTKRELDEEATDAGLSDE